MSKCQCDLCKCETNADYYEWFYKEIGKAIKETPQDMTFKQYVEYLYDGLLEYLK